MRNLAMGCLTAAAITVAGMAFSCPARAAAKVTVKTTFYDINGRSGDALVEAMDRRGPKHGFLARAIAQTRYTMRTDAVWAHADGNCRVVNPVVRLDVTYIYPRVTGPVSLPMKLRWKRFIKGVERHEKMHGKIARDMAGAAVAAIRKLRIADSSSCMASRAKLKRAVDTIVAAYEKKQVDFDAREHVPGGNVSTMLRALKK